MGLGGGRGERRASMRQNEALSARQFDDLNSAADVEAARREQRLQQARGVRGQNGLKEIVAGDAERRESVQRQCQGRHIVGLLGRQHGPDLLAEVPWIKWLPQHPSEVDAGEVVEISEARQDDHGNRPSALFDLRQEPRPILFGHRHVGHDDLDLGMSGRASRAEDAVATTAPA
jgi:hypothetical protein